jgi:protein PhnA
MWHDNQTVNLKQHSDLHHFLSTYIFNVEPGSDAEVTRGFLAVAPPEQRRRVIAQIEGVIKDQISLEELGTETNRWFGDVGEARDWLQSILKLLESASSGESLVVKDSNGAVLSEGDSVLVIKDLKVKGGSSDLKRGTLVKNIHLVNDAEVIECKVGGSTLVLKTCFLKKA